MEPETFMDSRTWSTAHSPEVPGNQKLSDEDDADGLLVVASGFTYRLHQRVTVRMKARSDLFQ